ncbi:MAG: hypothetical protein ABFD50_20910 [Smithella sp.]
MEQHENGIYMIEIRDEYGLVESAATCATAFECHKWAAEHKADDINLTN